METIINNLTDLEKKIVDYIESANVVKMSQILNYVPSKNTEFTQNVVRDLVNKEILIMKQSPIVTDWTYELSYFYKHYKNIL
jgi:hypothetical protein